jgi:hypothetical protein
VTQPLPLTAAQQRLLRTLVHYARQDRLPKTITPFPTGEPDQYAIHVQGAPSLMIEGLYNLDALCRAGVLSRRWDRMGFGKIYRLTDASYKAVEENFAGIELSAPDEGAYDLRTMFYAMSGGDLLPEPLEALLPFAPARMDAARRATWVDRLIELLLAAVKPRLPLARRKAYDQAARELQEQLKTGVGNPETIRMLMADVALVGRIAAPAELATAAWPLVYPLMLLA